MTTGRSVSPPSPSEAAGGFDLVEELSWRGLIAQESQGVRERLARGPISGYIGFDASAASLHVGHLVQVFLLTHLQRAGGRPVIVIGGATGVIGDPSGKSSERNLLDDHTIESNAAALREQLSRFLDFGEGPAGARMLDNREWLGRYGIVDFLREIGRHFSVPSMLAKESVRARLGGGMSFTEFSYMTLQAADFLHLHRDHGVELQLGGADQWGNITAGLELIRRVDAQSAGGGAVREAGPEPGLEAVREAGPEPGLEAVREAGPEPGLEAVAEDDAGREPTAYGLGSPLLLTRNGQKMGKSERGAVFVDRQLTSPYEFYQYWLGDDDALVPSHLRWLTLLERAEIESIEAQAAEHPEARPGQHALAYDLTARIHGHAEAELQLRVAEAAFGGGRITDPAVLDVLFDAVGGFRLTPELLGTDPVTVTVASGLAASRGEARRIVQQGGLTINGERVTAIDASLPAPVAGRYLVVRAGRKRLAVGRLEDGRPHVG